MITRMEKFGDATLLFTKVNGEEKQIGIVEKERYSHTATLLEYGNLYNERNLNFSTADQAIQAIIKKYKEINDWSVDNEG